MAIRVALLSAFCLTMSSCMSSGLDLGMSPNVDKSISTHSVPGEVSIPDTVSDEATVRNAVSSADLQRLNGESTLPWANTSTGSAGVISQIREESVGSYSCRTFSTTRHSYRGVSNYAGKACLVGSGQWQLVTFREL